MTISLDVINFKSSSPHGLACTLMPEVNYFWYVEVLFKFIFCRQNVETLQFATKQRTKLLFFTTGYDIPRSQTRAQMTISQYRPDVVETTSNEEKQPTTHARSLYIVFTSGHDQTAYRWSTKKCGRVIHGNPDDFSHRCCLDRRFHRKDDFSSTRCRLDPNSQ